MRRKDVHPLAWDSKAASGVSAPYSDVVEEPTIDRRRSARATFMIIATVALAAIAVVIGALTWPSRDAAAFDPASRTQEIIESELTRQGVRGLEITDVHCVKDTSTRYECTVASRRDGVEATVEGTLACDGTDPADYCSWSGELPAA